MGSCVNARFHHSDAGTDEAVWLGAPSLRRAPPLDLSPFTRLIVVSAHPDDETLSAGGLIATAAERSMDIDVVVATDGEASHSRSETHSRARLAAIRRIEVAQAVQILAPDARLHLLDLGDGRLRSGQVELTDRLVALIGHTGPTTLLVSTWRGDQHPDHEAAGFAAASASWRTDALHLEAPIWLWHWGDPTQLSEYRARHDATLQHLELSATTLARKTGAMARHHSQTEPLSPAPGDETLLSPEMLAHFTRSFEAFIHHPPGESDPFEQLHRRDTDPWGTRRLWYERRKRDLTLAALPRESYRTILDIGCSVGALTGELALRAESLTALDASPRALELARRHHTSERIKWLRCSIPEQWPDCDAELVMVSEIGYFFSPRRLRHLAQRVAHMRAETVVACHWRHPLQGWPLTSADVHRVFEEALSMPRVLSIQDRDFELVVWSWNAHG